MTLMYPSGSQSVKCAACNYVTSIGAQGSGSSSRKDSASSHLVVIENPPTIDEASGKVVSNMAVGVAEDSQ